MTFLRPFIASWLAWAACLASLVASEQFTQTLPTGTQAATHGLTLTLESDWIHGPGYRPVRVVARPVKPGPLPYDRALRIEFAMRDYSSGSTRTIENLELPAGSTSGKVLLLVPNIDSRAFWTLDVYENGVKLNELCTTTYSSSNTDDAISALYVQPLPRGASPPFNDFLPKGVSNAGRPWNGPPNATPDPAVWAPSELPENWLAYTSLDLMSISISDIKRLTPERFEALRRWTHSGGTLLVHSFAGPDAVPPSASPKISTSGNAISNLAELERERDPSADLETRRYGLGRVILVAGPFNKQMRSELQSELETKLLLEPEYYARSRLGVDVAASEMSYFSFLIPGVKLPPVGAFVLLITGFVLVMGPVNYLVLRFKKKLYLLPLTIAAGALLVTGGLIGYAVLHDGLGVRLRTRSYTLLDQRAGLTDSFSRQAYYAGLAPSGGLVFPNHAAVFPLQLGDEDFRRQREISWPAETQQLRRGYFPSRTTTQMMVLSSAPSELALRVSPARENSAPTVKNELGGEIVALSLCDERGRYFAGENISEGELRELAATDQNQIARPVSNGIGKERLRPPSFELSGVTSRRYRRYYPYMNSGEEDTDNVSKSTMERRLTELANSACTLEPRSYVAIVGQSPSVPVGYEKAQELGSFHVVEGKW